MAAGISYRNFSFRASLLVAGALGVYARSPDGIVILRRTENIQFPADAGFNNVKTYGAGGDGKTDDTRAFQDAITATWPANDGGHPNNFKTLYIPNGTYLRDNATGFGAGANKSRSIPKMAWEFKTLKRMLQVLT